MSKKHKKYVEESEDMIEMRDFKVAPEEVYVEESSSIFDANPNQSKPTYPNFEKTSQPLLNKKISAPQPQLQPQQPKYPPPSNLFPAQKSGVIRMNGMAFDVTEKNKPKTIPSGHKGVQPPPQKPRVPDMSVNCKWCTLEQLVAGNSHIFVCCVCNNMNECRPVHNMFICYGCKTQVCYQLGVSNMIRCSKCRTINKVPISVTPNYQPSSQIKERPRENEPLRPEYLEKLKPNLSLAPRLEQKEEDIILLDEEPTDLNLVEREPPRKKEFREQYPELYPNFQEPYQHSANLYTSNENSKQTKL